MIRMALALLISLVVLTAGVNSAQAVPTLSLWDPSLGAGSAIVVTDESPLDEYSIANGFPLPAAIGTVKYSGSLGTWLVTVTTGLTKPITGGPVYGQMDLSSVEVSTASGGTIHLMFSDDFFGPTPPPSSATADIGGTTSGTVLYNTYLDIFNVAWDLNMWLAPPPPLLPPVLTAMGFSSPPTSFSGTATAPIIAPVSYSLTQLVMVTHAGAGTTSFDASLNVPEPGTLLLLGAGLLMAGVAIRKVI